MRERDRLAAVDPQSDNVGPRTFRSLIQSFRQARWRRWSGCRDLARNAAARHALAGSAARTMRALSIAASQRLGVSLLAPDEAGYPPRLAVARRCASFARRTRRAGAADAACHRDRRLAQRLRRRAEICRHAGARSRRRRVLSSPQAWRAGIDQAAHRASIESGTVAVLAGGHDRIYPPEHEDLLATIIG